MAQGAVKPVAWEIWSQFEAALSWHWNKPQPQNLENLRVHFKHIFLLLCFLHEMVALWPFPEAEWLRG